MLPGQNFQKESPEQQKNSHNRKIVVFALIFFVVAITVARTLINDKTNMLAASVSAFPPGSGVPSQNTIALFTPDNYGPSIFGFGITPRPINGDMSKYRPTKADYSFLRNNPNTPWFIAQWRNPDDLRYGSDNGSCKSSTHSSVCMLNGVGGSAYRISLWQNGYNTVPCAGSTDKDASLNSEFDLFVQPDPYGNYTKLTKSPALNTLSNLYATFAVEIPSRAIGNRCSKISGNPWHDQTASVASFIFGNDASGQSIFYQIMIESSNAKDKDICNNNSYWYYNPNPGKPQMYGVNESLGSYTGSCVRPGSGRQGPYKLDILSHIARLIRDNPNLNKDLSQWKLGGVYFGSLGYGDFSQTSTWDSIGIFAISKKIVPDTAPVGVLEHLNCARVSGWVCDADNINTPVAVKFYDGPIASGKYIGSKTLTNEIRDSAIAMRCGGNSAHGFTNDMLVSMKDGVAHTIYAYMTDIDSTGTVIPGTFAMQGSPKTILCSKK